MAATGRGSRVFLVALCLAPLVYITAYPGFDVLRLPYTAAVAAGLGIVWLVGVKRGLPMGSIEPRLAWAIAGYFAVQLFSLLRARNSGEGLEQISRDLSAAMVFIVLAAGPLSRELVVRTLPRGVAAAAGLVALVGLGQSAGVSPPWITLQELYISTLGNPNYGGTYMAMTIPLTLGLMAAEERMRPRVALGLSVAAQGGYAAVSGSRGGWVGMAAALAFVAVIAGMQSRFRRKHVALAAAAGLVFVACFLLLGARQFPDRMERLTNFGSWTLRVRLGIWKETVGIVGESPILGVGGTNFKEWYGRHRSDEEVRLHSLNLDPWTVPDMDNCHNGHLQILAESGLAGLAAWVVVILLLFRAAGAAASWDWARLGAGASMVGFLVSDFFNTLHIQTAHWVLFWAAAALLVAREPAAEEKRASWRWALTAGLCLAQAVLLSFQIGTVMAYEHYRRSFQERDARVVIDLLERASELDPGAFTVRHELAMVYFRTQQIAKAREQFEIILRLNPQIPGDRLGLALCELAMHREKEGEAILKDLTARLPSWPLPWVKLGLLEMSRKNDASALAYFEEALAKRPDFGEARARRGIARARLGRVEEAAEDFRQAAALRFPCRVDELPRVETDDLRSIPALAPFFAGSR